jgi:hypothetical protein
MNTKITKSGCRKNEVQGKGLGLGFSSMGGISNSAGSKSRPFLEHNKKN